jgi:hypothetical protein
MNDVNQQVFSFSFDKQPGILYFDPYNEIVLKQASLTVGIVEENIGKQTFSLQQNFPNPVKDQTTFTYSLPQASQVSLALYDMTGKKVMDLLEEWQSLGTHSITKDLSGLKSGLYLCRMSAGGESASIRMTVGR